MKRALLLFAPFLLALGGNDDPQAGKALKCPLTFVTVSAPGTFEVGSPSGDPYRDGWEYNATLTIDYAFRVSTTEVTRCLWQQVMKWDRDPFADCRDCPVAGVSWDDVTTFADRLSARDGLQQCYTDYSADNILSCTGYRLPTTAEFEYLTRDGDAYPDGGTISTPSDRDDCVVDNGFHGDAQYCIRARVSNSGRPGYCATFASPSDAGVDGCTHTEPVAQLSPTSHGIYDIRGNLYEWTDTQYCGGTWPVTTNPTGSECPDAGPTPIREKRGGSHRENTRHHRYGMRSFDQPDRRVDNIGFRLVLNGAS